MRPLPITILVLTLSVPAVAQAPRAPRVYVEHLRGPIQIRELRRAWRPRRFRRCQRELHADAEHLQVRIDPDASIHVDTGRPTPTIPPDLECVVEVIRTARFSPQTEATEAYVSVFFGPDGSPDPPGRRISRARASR